VRANEVNAKNGRARGDKPGERAATTRTRYLSERRSHGESTMERDPRSQRLPGRRLQRRGHAGLTRIRM